MSIEPTTQLEWVEKWCKQRCYPIDQAWAKKYAKQAWKQRQAELAEAYAISDCWYCQLGISSGRISLRNVPEPPNWKSTLCEKHVEMVTPVHQDREDVVCEICGEGYKYKPWNKVVGRQDKRCYCRKCSSRFAIRHLDDDRLVEGQPDELDHLTNFEKTYEGQQDK